MPIFLNFVNKWQVQLYNEACIVAYVDMYISQNAQV